MIESGRILPLKVLVREIKRTDKVGAIYIPTAVVKTPTISGEVVIVGNIPQTGQFKDFIIKPGDKILHSPHSFVTVEIDGEELRLLNVLEILFIY